MTAQSEARFMELAARKIDGELSDMQAIELDALLAEDPSLAAKIIAQQKMKGVSETMKFTEIPEKHREKYWLGIYNQLERGIAWTLVSLGFSILAIWALWEGINGVLADRGLPPLAKFAVLALIIGGVFLLVSVVREKLVLRKTDPYKEIER